GSGGQFTIVREADRFWDYQHTERKDQSWRLDYRTEKSEGNGDNFCCHGMLLGIPCFFRLLTLIVELYFFFFQVPADMVLMRTTEASGACFIRTDQLDGETDWKLR